MDGPGRERSAELGLDDELGLGANSLLPTAAAAFFWALGGGAAARRLLAGAACWAGALCKLLSPLDGLGAGDVGGGGGGGR